MALNIPEHLNPWGTPEFSAPSIGAADPSRQSMIGTLQWPEASSYKRGSGDTDFWTGGKMYDPYAEGWDPYGALGPGGSLGHVSPYVPDTPRPWDIGSGQPGPFSKPDIQAALKGAAYTELTSSTVPGGFRDHASYAFDTYLSGVESALASYYGETLASKWAGGEYGWFPGQESTAAEAITGTGPESLMKPTPYGIYGTLGDDYTATTGSTLGDFYKDWAAYRGKIKEGEAPGGSAGAWADAKMPGTYVEGLYGEAEAAGTYSAGLKGLYQRIYEGGFDDLTAGAKVDTYLTNRETAVQKYFGTDPEGIGAAVLGDWDPDQGFDTVKPTDLEGVEITTDSTMDDIEEGISKYGENSLMGRHLSDIREIKLNIDDIGELTGTYKGLFDDQKTELESLFGSGTELAPGMGSSLSTAKGTISTIANDWYNTPAGGEGMLQTAIANAASSADLARSIYQDVLEGTSNSFFGTDDITPDDLVIWGVMNADGDLLLDANAGTALEGDAYEGESELAYVIRTNLVDPEDAGAFSQYSTAHADAVTKKADDIQGVHESFQTEFKKISSEFAQGEMAIKDRMAEQKGLRTGTIERAKDQIREDISTSFGDEKSKWQEGQSDLQTQFDQHTQNIAATLVEAWRAGYSETGDIQTAEGVMNDSLGVVYGTYTVVGGSGETFSHTAETIQELMSQGGSNAVSPTITHNGEPNTAITVTNIGQWGEAYNIYQTGKLGRFGTTEDITAATGLSPGKNGEWGDSNDETFDPSTGKWVKGAIQTKMVGGVELPIDPRTNEVIDPEDFNIGGAYGQGLQQYLGDYERVFGDLEPKIATGQDITADTTPGVLYGGKDPITGEFLISEGTFGEAGKKGFEDIEEQERGVGTSKSDRLGGIQEYFGPSSKGEQGIIDAFVEQGTTAENATIDQWNETFKITHGQDQSIEGQMQILQTSMEGNADQYIQDLQVKLAENNALASIFTEEWYQDDAGDWQIRKDEEGRSYGAIAAGGCLAGGGIGAHAGGLVGAGIGCVLGAVGASVAAVVADEMTHCCTAAAKYHGMSKMKVAKLRVWHRKQSKLWQKGYDVWGKIVADNLVSKYKWAGNATEGFYEWVIKNNKTIDGLIAMAFILPGSYAIGTYISIKDAFNRNIILGRSK